MGILAASFYNFSYSVVAIQLPNCNNRMGLDRPVVYNRIVPKRDGWAPEATNEAPNESVTDMFACARIRLLNSSLSVFNITSGI
jgi:hypothetical protein